MITKKLLVFLFLGVVTAGLSGCKSEDQMKAQISELTSKLDEANKKSAQQTEELKAANHDIRELKELVAKLGNAVVDMKKEVGDRRNGASKKAANPTRIKSKKASLTSKKSHHNRR